MINTDASTLPSPQSLGLPAQFSGWHPGQDEGIQAVVEAVKLSRADGIRRIVAICAPTSHGKTVYSAATHLITGARTAHLTETKALQTQMMGDFEGVGLVDIRGQNGYECLQDARLNGLRLNLVMVDDGPCHGGYPCSLQDEGCTYYGRGGALWNASDASYLTTNYAYWMTQHEYGQGLGDAPDSGSPRPFELLVCDEADTVFNSLTSFMAVTITEADAKQYCGRSLPRRGSGLADLQWWMADAKDAVGGGGWRTSRIGRRSPR